MRKPSARSSLADARALIQVGDQVVVPRLGYDRPGRVVKLDQRKKTAKIAIGHVTWDVSIDELVPQAPRTPGQAGSPKPARRGRICASRRSHSTSSSRSS